ncbi:hypothetical protein KUH03_16535 [Sphingobacterium sp. E70]|nr:hypothetical protein [Sphingobacterium sp. E70]ULT28062.1 hypothetical protein KUH03_16535 [Sphingobacterium sp. E70]
MEQKFNVKFGYDASISDQKINELVNLEKLKRKRLPNSSGRFLTGILR